MAVFLAPILNTQIENSNGAPLSGGTVEVYLAGTSTPSTTYSDKAGLVPNTWPIVLNTLGLNNQGAVWLTGGFAYKFIVKDSLGIVQRTIDNVSGINDSTLTADQWVVFLGTPTYVSATSFTVAGDQTQTFQVGRRIRTNNTGGTIYSTITASVYGAPNTTVTVRNDSGVLDAGLSAVSYGVLSVQNTSYPGGPAFRVERTAAFSILGSTLTKVPLNVETFDTGNAFDPVTNFRFQPTIPGYYHFDGSLTLTNNGGTQLTDAAGYFYKNGAPTKTFGQFPVPSTVTRIFTTFSGTDLIYLNGTTDYAELWCYGSIAAAGGITVTGVMSGNFVQP